MANYLLRIDANACMALASSAALAKAISDQMTLEKTHGNLTGIARMCSALCGGGMDPRIDWSVIRPRHKSLTQSYFRMLLDGIDAGPVQFRHQAERLVSWRANYDADIKAKFARAAAHNANMARNAMIGFQTARAVRITALGALALLSGVGGVVGSAETIAAFGVETGMAGLTFSQGLLFGVGSKAVYNTANGWANNTENIKAVVISNGLQDAAQPFQQEAAQIGLEFAFYEQMRKWAKELNLGQETKAKIDLLQRRLANQLKRVKPDQKAVAGLKRQIARTTAEQAKGTGAVRKASLGTKALGALPVVWLAQDLWGIYGEAANDMKML